jgi:peptidoglycan hydrolase-like protein with peptidoglycan-binding domain
MKLSRALWVVIVSSLFPAMVFAQVPGEPKGPGTYDPVGSMRHAYERWAPSDAVRETQQALRDLGYYNGPLDGMMTPQFRTAIWNFQTAKGLPRTGRLDGPTIAALDLPATGAASPGGAPSNFGATSRPTPSGQVQAP